MRSWKLLGIVAGALMLAVAGAAAATAQTLLPWASPKSSEMLLVQAPAQVKPRVQPQRPHTRGDSEARRKEAINSWTVGLAAGRLEGAPLQFAAELARAVDDGDNMRVLPIVTRGPFDNVFDLLYLRGVDAAIVYGDVLEHFKKNPDVSGISRRINFLANLFPSELHIFVRPEIKSLKDLEGKPVNFNTEGTAAAFTGPIVLERLGIKVDAKFIPHTTAMQEMRKGDTFAATVWVSSKPLQPFLKGEWPAGFKFLPVPYSDSLDYYLPAYLEHADYPKLIGDGQRIETIAVPAVLAVYDWQNDSDRYKRLVRFVDYLFERLPKLQTEPGYHPAWKDVNLAASIPGWKRFQPLTDRIEKAARERPKAPAASAAAAVTGATSTDEAARREAARAAPGNPAEQERLFKEFLEWRRRQAQ